MEEPFLKIINYILSLPLQNKTTHAHHCAGHYFIIYERIKHVFVFILYKHRNYFFKNKRLQFI